MLFSSHCNELVISPIEQMIQKVTRIAHNPLAAAQEEENEAIALEKLNDTSKSKKTKWQMFLELFTFKKSDEILETDVLEKTIVKTGALLTLGFGEAGS